MELKKLQYDLTVCKPAETSEIDLNKPFCFVGKTEDELSLVCRTEDTPARTASREDGWKGFRVEGVLDFSLVGILAELTRILAENKIAVFAVSTFDTDYLLVKAENFEKAARAFEEAGIGVR